jgi:PPOX class probable F420-dependent enzyme
MVTESDLWQLVVEGREGILATNGSDGHPQLSNVLYVVDPERRVIRISTTANRAKARNIARDPRVALHVPGDDFWQYAVANGSAELSPVAKESRDVATDELFEIHRSFYGDLDRGAFDQEMIAHRRLVIRVEVDHLYGIISTSGRRPTSSA